MDAASRSSCLVEILLVIEAAVLRTMVSRSKSFDSGFPSLHSLSSLVRILDRSMDSLVPLRLVTQVTRCIVLTLVLNNQEQ